MIDFLEKEQATKEGRQLRTRWNVFLLVADDGMDYEQRQRVEARHRVQPVTRGHRERVKELFARVGHPLAKTM
jgi:hypothetical protein